MAEPQCGRAHRGLASFGSDEVASGSASVGLELELELHPGPFLSLDPVLFHH